MVQSKALQNEFIDGFKESLPIVTWLGKYRIKLTIDKNNSIYAVMSPYSAGETIVVLLFRIVETFMADTSAQLWNATAVKLFIDFMRMTVHQAF